jgi:hypothetical protein
MFLYKKRVFFFFSVVDQGLPWLAPNWPCISFDPAPHFSLQPPEASKKTYGEVGKVGHGAVNPQFPMHGTGHQKKAPAWDPPMRAEKRRGKRPRLVNPQ